MCRQTNEKVFEQQQKKRKRKEKRSRKITNINLLRTSVFHFIVDFSLAYCSQLGKFLKSALSSLCCLAQINKLHKTFVFGAYKTSDGSQCYCSVRKKCYTLFHHITTLSPIHPRQHRHRHTWFGNPCAQLYSIQKTHSRKTH